MPADAMQKTVPIAQFLGQLAVMVPGAVKTVELPTHLPDLRVDAVVPVKKPFYAKFWHVGNLIPPSAPSRSDVGTAAFSRWFKTSPQKMGRTYLRIRMILRFRE